MKARSGVDVTCANFSRAISDNLRVLSLNENTYDASGSSIATCALKVGLSHRWPQRCPRLQPPRCRAISHADRTASRNIGKTTRDRNHALPSTQEAKDKEKKLKAAGGGGGEGGAGSEELLLQIQTLTSEKAKEEELRNYMQLERVGTLVLCL